MIKTTMMFFLLVLPVSLLLYSPPVYANSNGPSSTSTSTSTSNYKYNVYNYDMTTPQFTPDGRLLQVEYASYASLLSLPLVAIQVDTTTGTIKEGEEMNNVDVNDTENDSILILLTLRSSMTQNRIVVLENNNNDHDGSTTNNSNNGKNICVAMSGILPDSIALLQVVLQRIAEQVRVYSSSSSSNSGIGNSYMSSSSSSSSASSLTALQVARTIADACQKHSFGGGIRPYGSTMLVCSCGSTSFTSSRTSKKTKQIIHPSTMYQTDPSGAILQIPIKQQQQQDDDDDDEKNNFKVRKSKGTNKTKSTSSFKQDMYIRWIVGGDLALQRQLRKQLESNLSKLQQQNNDSHSIDRNNNNKKIKKNKQKKNILPLSKILSSLIPTMVKEIQKYKRQTGGSDSNSDTLSTSDSKLFSSESNDVPSIEVVILSSKLGIHRLTTNQINAMVQ